MSATARDTTGTIDQLRQLWLEWDPIGVIVDGWPDDEYDSYLGPTLQRLSSGASTEDIASWLEHVRRDLMGLVSNESSQAHSQAFAQKLQQWHSGIRGQGET